MNRTAVFLGTAALLAVVALAAGLPRLTHHGDVPVVTTTAPLPNIAGARQGSLTLTTRVSHPFIAPGQNDVYVTADITAQEVAGAKRSPVNLALVIDRSGSMAGEKLNNAKNAARELVTQLRSTDRLSIVNYGSDVRSLEGLLCTTENKTKMLSYIDAIWDEGGTNIGDGLTTGRGLLMAAMADFKVNRMVLISDGQPTEGITETSGLTSIVRDARSMGISVSSIGVGTDFNEVLMESLAEVGSGAYAYLEDSSQLSSIFQRDLNAAGMQVAQGVTLRVEAPAGSELVEVLGRATDATNRSNQFISLPDMAAGQQERVVMHFRVNGYANGSTLTVSGVSLAYTDLLQGQAVNTSVNIATIVSDNPATVADNRDKEAIVFAARARTAQNTREASDALRNGDRRRALELMNENPVLLEEAAAIAGPAAVARDMQEQRQTISDLNAAKGEAGANTWSKENRKKARVDFGQLGSTY